MRKIIVIFVFFAVMLIIQLGFSNKAFGDLVFSPLSHHIEVPPGARGSVKVFLSNEGKKELSVEVKITDLYLDPINGNYSTFSNDKDKMNSESQSDFRFSCAKWFEKQEIQIFLKPGQSILTEIPVRVPRNATKGGYTAILQISPKEITNGSNIESKTDTSMSVKVSMGGLVPVFLDVRRPNSVLTRSGRYCEIEKFEVIETKEGLQFNVTVANKGLNFITAVGEVRILKDSKGFIIPLSGGGEAFIPPGQKLTMSHTILKPYRPGNYSTEAIIDYGGFRSARATFEFKVNKDSLDSSGVYQEKEKKIDDIIVLSVNKDSMTTNILPGISRNFTVSLGNDSEKEVEVEGIASDVSEIESTRFSQNIEILPNKFKIEPGKKQNIRIAVKCPNPLQDGNKYVQILFRPKVNGTKILDENLSDIFAVPVFLLLENVKGEKIIKASITGVNFSVQEKEDGQRYPLVNVTFNNDGNIQLQPFLEVSMEEISSGESEEAAVLVKPGETIQPFKTPPSNSLVLPGMEGAVSGESDQPLGKAEGKIHYKVDIRLKEGNNEIATTSTEFEIDKEGKITGIQESGQ